jgi:hypothetical protein
MPDYPWKDHPEAVLGTVYFYFAYKGDPTKIPDAQLQAFVAAHQDSAGSLSAEKVKIAVHAVRKLDTGKGKFGPSELLMSIWEALVPLM